MLLSSTAVVGWKLFFNKLSGGQTSNTVLVGNQLLESWTLPKNTCCQLWDWQEYSRCALNNKWGEATARVLFFFFCRQHLSPFPGSGCESLISLCLRQTLTQNFYHANLPVSTLEPLNQRMSPSSVFKCCFRNTGMPFGPALVLPELWSFAQKT